MEALRSQSDPFDRLAQGYDESFTTSALGRCLRAMVWQRLDSAFVAGDRVLEIGCGTGEDAVRLASRGIDVLATDTSMSMLRVARDKAKRANCARRIEFRHAPMERLGTDLAGQRFDGVYSNFGAINCVSGLDRVVPDIAALLAPGASLVWVVMGRYVPWEWIWFLVRGDWRKAFRRLDRDGTDWHGLRVHYPTPAELARMLRPHFSSVHACALGLVLPPSYAARWLERSRNSLGVLARLERVVQRWQVLSAFADHYITEAKRASA